MEIYDIEWSNGWHSDCGGFGAKWTCPVCDFELTWAPNMWWQLECDCENIEWTFNFTVNRRNIK